jgi:Putative peptidoglycan binding domain
MAAGIGASTSSGTMSIENTLPVDDQPASFRYSNPGAQFPSKEAAKFGQLGFGTIDHGQFKIALFPNPVNGAAANFDLLNRKYTGMSIGDAGTIWTGSHGFGIPGHDPSIILTQDMLNDQATAIDLLKAIAGRESGRGNNLTEDQWRQAHAMFKAASADNYLKGQPAPVPANPIAGTPSGAGLLKRAREHLHEEYRNVLVPKDDANYKGPWDCAEFISWLVFQEAHVLYGCVDDSVPPAKADAYTGAFKTDVARLGKKVSVAEAAATVGGILLRYPPAPGAMGHVVLCDGRGGTVEAKGKLYGVVEDTVQNRPWDTGVLIPNIQYDSGTPISVTPPAVIYAPNAPGMDTGVIKRIQTALLSSGFNPGVINGEFSTDTENAVVNFQDAKGLTVDGQIGSETATALGISLKPDATQDQDPVGPVGGAGPTDPGQTPLDPKLAPLLPLILALLSKETPMAADPAKPGQTVDPTSLILLLLLPSLLGGKQPDITQFLSTILAGQTAAPGTAASGPKPAPAQASGQGTQTQPSPPQTANDVIALLLPLLIQKITGQPLPVTTLVTPTTPPQPDPSTQSILTKPSVQIGAGALGISTILQALGTIGMPFGITGGPAAPSMAGTFATLIPLIISVFGATSGFGTLANVGSALLGGLASAVNKSK